MALILITVNDTETGPAVSIIGEPPLKPDADALMSPAQVVALTMLASLKTEPVLEDFGLVELMNNDANAPAELADAEQPN